MWKSSHWLWHALIHALFETCLQQNPDPDTSHRLAPAPWCWHQSLHVPIPRVNNPQPNATLTLAFYFFSIGNQINSADIPQRIKVVLSKLKQLFAIQ